ncbi:K(+)/H(+) antiporter [Allomyces arbusculus]|nr:K(+)/H(+) antiporter [Allomyces arbusculus]
MVAVQLFSGLVAAPLSSAASMPAAHLAKRSSGASDSMWSGGNPFASASNPLPLFLVQVIVVVLMTRVLSLILKFFRQPRVIAEVIGGILLGPSALGQIPGFTKALFPPSSLGMFGLIANFGLILYLFIVGLELDPRMVATNLRKSVAISVAGIAVPFGAGIAVSFALYDSLMPEDTKVPFSSFFLFLGVAMSITAFPVLARILTETNLLTTRVGMTTISAAAVDDVVAWSMLALVIAIINASDALTALYTFLVVLAFAAFMIFAVRPVLVRLIQRSATSSTLNEFLVFVTFILIFAAAMFTEVIGVHAIFGAFLVGVIIPHESGFAIALTEKVEDLVTIVLLPLYFALSGLKTRLGLLDTATTWGLLVLVLVTACTGKIVGCTMASRFTGLSWRDSIGVGILMNTKGLVELIVLNVGLDAGVISPRIHAICVLMAILTTLITTPVVTWMKLGHDELAARDRALAAGTHHGDDSQLVVVALDAMDHVPSVMAVTQALAHPTHALRLTELTDRTSAVMRAKDRAHALAKDAVVNVFRTFGTLSRVPVAGTALEIAPRADWGKVIAAATAALRSPLAVLVAHEPRNVGTAQVAVETCVHVHGAAVAVVVDRRNAAVEREEEVAIVSMVPVPAPAQLVFYFLGGADDRAAAALVAHMAKSGRFARVTVVRVRFGTAPDAPAVKDARRGSKSLVAGVVTAVRARKKSGTQAAAPGLGSGPNDSLAALVPESDENGESPQPSPAGKLPLTWTISGDSSGGILSPARPLVRSLTRGTTASASPVASPDEAALDALVAAVPHVHVVDLHSTDPARAVADHAASHTKSSGADDIVVVGRRHAIVAMAAAANDNEEIAPAVSSGVTRRSLLALSGIFRGAVTAPGEVDAGVDPDRAALGEVGARLVGVENAGGVLVVVQAGAAELEGVRVAGAEVEAPLLHGGGVVEEHGGGAQAARDATGE